MAVNFRSTKSLGRVAVTSLIVVRLGLPRTTPRKPRSSIRRSIVQRATRIPSRFS